MATGTGRGSKTLVPDTVAELIGRYAKRLHRARLCYGHGTANARDEAAALVFYVLGLDHGQAASAYRLSVPPEAVESLETLLQARVQGRKPLPYLTGEAWFAGLPFYVDERVLIPRSPFAELIARRFAPWLGSARVASILEIGTGSGCMAVALARAFPESRVLATDISPDALAVAARNVDRHGLVHRVTLRHADLFAGLEGVFDLIVSNPPYVPEEEIDTLPLEYGHEPRLALVSGADGMATPARILHHAAGFLTPQGWLALEVGGGSVALEARFPKVPFLWPLLVHGGDGIALVSAADLGPDRLPDPAA